ncbi:MAG: MMPL family transporter [Methylococcales bacterium]
MSIKNHSSNLFSRFSEYSLRYPWVMLCIIGLLAVLALQYTVKHLSINTDTAELIAPDAPFQQNRRNFEKAFAQDMHTLLLVVESDTPELTKAATKRLGRLLSADKTNFDAVSIPNDEPFFHQNGLLYLDNKELQDLSNNLSQAQPFIGRIAQEPNLSGFFSIFEDVLTSADKTRDLPLDLTTLINKIVSAMHKTLNSENSLLSWENLIAEKKSQPNKGFIIVSPKFDYAQIRPAEQAIAVIHQAIAHIQDPNLPSVKVWVTGEVGLEDDELSGMSAGTFTASIFSIVLVFFILLIAYRSLLFTLATLVTLAIGMVFCGAFAAFAVRELNLISVAFAVSNIGLGVEYAIHFCLRYRDNLNHHIERSRALRSTLISTTPSLLLCAGTTAIGLYAFIPTDYKGVSELGLLAGTSLFICLMVTLTALPALLKFIPVSAPAATVKSRPAYSTLVERMAKLTLHYAKPITLITGLFAIASIALVFKVKTDFNPINLRDPNTESVVAFKNLMKDKETTPMTLTVLVKDEKQVTALQKQLAVLASVDKTISLFDFIPDDQEEKLAMIDEMGLLLGSQAQGFPALKPDANPAAGIVRLIAAIEAGLPAKTDKLEIAALQAFKRELQDVLLELDTRQEPDRRMFIEKLQTTLLGTLPTVMNELLRGFNAKEVALDDLPVDFKARWLSKEGWYRIQIYPKKDLNDLVALQTFITDIQAIAPNATDLPVMYLESMKEVIAAFQQAIIIALITIASLLFAIRRSVTDTLLVMTPLILAGLFTMASTVVTGTPINFANIIALPLLLGMGVDNGIHMVEKLHHSLSEDQNIYQSSTARAMFYGALTTISSFAGLAFSPHQGIASMGLIITMGIFWIMVCTFIILPALSKLFIKATVVA